MLYNSKDVKASERTVIHHRQFFSNVTIQISLKGLNLINPLSLTPTENANSFSLNDLSKQRFQSTSQASVQANKKSVWFSMLRSTMPENSVLFQSIQKLTDHKLQRKAETIFHRLAKWDFQKTWTKTVNYHIIDVKMHPQMWVLVCVTWMYVYARKCLSLHEFWTKRQKWIS